MQVRVDDRGVALQVGAALLLAFVVVAVSVYQVQVVPDQNRAVEQRHGEQVVAELGSVRDAVVSVPGGGSGRSVTVGLGTTYPSRTLFVNPPPVSGQLRTTTTAPITVANATAGGEVGDYWNGSARSVPTRALVYDPDYNERTGAPDTVYGNTVLFDEYRTDGQYVPRTDQTLIDGDTITLVALRGNVGIGSVRSVSVDVRAASTSTRVVPVSSTSGDPITVTVPTRLPADQWRELLADESNVTAVTRYADGPGEFDLVNVTLEPGDYRLRMAKAGVGRGVGAEQPAYLTDVRGNDATVPAGGNRTLTVEVRDRYNNPVSGRNVEAGVVDGGGTVAGTGVATTDAEGQASFTYRAPDDPGTVRVAINLTTPDDPAPFEQVNATVTVESSGGAGGADGAYAVDWTAAEPAAALDCDANLSSCTLDASASGTADLTVTTAPVAQDASVQYAVDDTAVATVGSSGGRTNGSGVDAVTLTATANGTVRVYAASGGSGDVLEVTVENVSDATTGSALFTAVEPDPEKLDDSAGEFVRVQVPAGTDTAGWTIVDDEGPSQNTSLPTGETGTLYFARNPAKFSEVWSVDPTKVFELETKLSNGGERLRLLDDADAVIDEFGYGGASTSGGWSLTVGAGEVAYRVRSGGSYVDTDAGTDWDLAEENVFFNTRDATLPNPGAVFVDTRFSSYLESIDRDGTVGFFDATGSEVVALGPMTEDLDGDGRVEVPYVDPNAGELRIVDFAGEESVFVGSGGLPNGAGVSTSTARLGVGDLDGDGTPAVVFTDDDNHLWRKEVGGTPTRVVYTPGNSPNTKFASGFGVAGVADVDDDGDPELVYATTGPEVAYVDDVGTSDPDREKLGATPSAGYAIGSPADLDGDPRIEVPYVDGNGEVAVVDETETTSVLTDTGGSVGSASLGTMDVAGDAREEVIYRDGNRNSRLFYVGAGGLTGRLDDEFGYPQTARGSQGAALLRPGAYAGDPAARGAGDRPTTRGREGT